MSSLLTKTKSSLSTASQKAKDKVKEKSDETKAKMDAAAVQMMDDFMDQMKLLSGPMKESGFKLDDISIKIQLTPAIACRIENIDEDAHWDDDRIDDELLNKTGKLIAWALKQADKARHKFKNDTTRFSSFEFECPIPVLTLSFTPRDDGDTKEPNEEVDNTVTVDESVNEFLAFYDLLEYASELAELGGDKLAHLKELKETEIDALCDSMNLKLLHKSTFVRALKELKDGSYATKQ